MNENEFIRQQKAAVERMRELNSRSVYGTNSNHHMPPVPPFVKVPESGRQQNSNLHNTQFNNNKNRAKTNSDTETRNPQAASEQTSDSQPNSDRSNNNSGGVNSFFDGLNLPFLDMFKKDGDMTLIVGLLLILLSEKADKKLLFALIYILI